MSTTTNLADFGYREREELIELLQAWNSEGLPEDFEDDGVHPMFNTLSGNVFLTNSEYQVVMINPETGILESWYFTPYHGNEGFACDLKEMYESDGENWNQDDIDYLIDLGIIEVEPESEDEDDE